MEIIGLDLFVRHFNGQMHKFVLIGGTACHLNLQEQGLSFRTTKDLDIVLILEMEKVDSQFSQLFWEFIRSGRYTVKQRSSGKPIFYRFEKPERQSVPVYD